MVRNTFTDAIIPDSQGQRLIGNPAHGGEQMFELY
jgi:hypothetical protein